MTNRRLALAFICACLASVVASAQGPVPAIAMPDLFFRPREGKGGSKSIAARSVGACRGSDIQNL